MKKYLFFILIITILLSLLSGCGVSDNKPSSIDSLFVKPEKYAAIVNVQINPSFDIYLDENAIVLAIEPKNEDAKAIDFSNMIGLHLWAAMRNFMETINKKGCINKETIALVDFVEGEENITNVNVIEIIEDSCSDAVAKETVNASIDSVLQASLKKEYGCDCVACANWYERKYMFGEWKYKRAYDGYMEEWKKFLEEMDKNDPQYELSSKSFDAMTFESYMDGPAKANFYLLYEALHGEVEHKEKEVTYKILESVINPYNGKVQNTAGELTAEKFYEKYLDDESVGPIEGLEKGYYAPVEVYVNGEKQEGWYNLIAYQCNGKWYVIDGTVQSFG